MKNFLLSVFMVVMFFGHLGPVEASGTGTVHHKTLQVDGLDIFYREAGSSDKPTLLLLHGFPTSSHMFRGLIPMLADDFHVLAPDYPGFGFSSAPAVEDFEYSFDNLTNVVEQFIALKGVDKFSLYVMDYGAPIGFRIASSQPERIESIIVQNGNAYDEGIDNDFWAPIKLYWDNKTEENAKPLRDFLGLEGTKWQFTHGVRDVSKISPDNWAHVQPLLDRPGNKDIQLELFYSYGTNPPLYPEWQEYFRTHQPPMLIVWGKNDVIFPEAGAHPYKRDVKDLEFHILDTGHFALEEDGAFIADKIRSFIKSRS